MDFDKDHFEDETELSPLEEEELVGDSDEIVEAEEEVMIIADDGEDEPAPAAKPVAKKPAAKPAKKAAAKPKKARKKKPTKKPAKKAAKKSKPKKAAKKKKRR